jgi:hypothetical protein
VLLYNNAACSRWNFGLALQAADAAQMREGDVLGSCLMTHMHQERPSAARGLPRMETPAQYREYAAECYRLASAAKMDEHRKMLREIARAWAKVAEEAEEAKAHRVRLT